MIYGIAIVMRGEPSGTEWGEREARLGEGSRACRNCKELLMMSEHDSEKVSSEIAKIESGEKDHDRDVVGSVLCLTSVNQVSQRGCRRCSKPL